MSCSTARIVPKEAVTLTGRMNSVSGGKALKGESCWAMESGGTVRNVVYYQFIGDKELLEKLHEEDAIVTVKAVILKDKEGACPIGVVAEVYEIVSLRSQKN